MTTHGGGHSPRQNDGSVSHRAHDTPAHNDAEQALAHVHLRSAEVPIARASCARAMGEEPSGNARPQGARNVGASAAFRWFVERGGPAFRRSRATATRRRGTPRGPGDASSRRTPREADTESRSTASRICRRRPAPRSEDLWAGAASPPAIRPIARIPSPIGIGAFQRFHRSPSAAAAIADTTTRTTTARCSTVPDHCRERNHSDGVDVRPTTGPTFPGRPTRRVYIEVRRSLRRGLRSATGTGCVTNLSPGLAATTFQSCPRAGLRLLTKSLAARTSWVRAVPPRVEAVRLLVGLITRRSRVQIPPRHQSPQVRGPSAVRRRRLCDHRVTKRR